MTQSNLHRVVGYMNDLAPIYGFGGNGASNTGYGMGPGNGGAGSWIASVRNGQGNGPMKDRIDLTRSGSYG